MCVDSARVLFVLVFYPFPLVEGNMKSMEMRNPFSGFNAAKDKGIKGKRSGKVQTSFSHRFIWQTHKWLQVLTVGICVVYVTPGWLHHSPQGEGVVMWLIRISKIKGPGKLHALRLSVEVTVRGKPGPEQVGRIRRGCGSKQTRSHCSAKAPPTGHDK